MQTTEDNTRSAPFLPSQTTNFCISKFGQWNLKLNRKTAEDFELIQAFVIKKQQEQQPETVAVEGTKDQKKRIPKKPQQTPYDRMLQARAKKHSDNVKAEQALLEVDDEVEKALEEIYEDFPKAQGLLERDDGRNKKGNTAHEKAQGDINAAKNTRSWSRNVVNRDENKSAAFLSVSRSNTAMSKAVAKGKGYNPDIAYRPKYNLVEKGVASGIKYEKRIPFFDSRFDIFYGQDKEYTQQMLMEDEMAGGQFSLIQNQGEKSNSKGQAAANAYSDEQLGRGALPNGGVRHPQSTKRLKTLQKLYKSYEQSQQLAENKQTAEVSREELGVLHLKKQLSKPKSSTMQKFNPSSKSFHSVAALAAKEPRQPRSKSNLPTAVQATDKHEADSSGSHGSHKSQGSDDAALKVPKDQKLAAPNSRTQQIQSVSHWNLEKFAFDLQQNNTEFHQTVNGSSAPWPGEMGGLDGAQAKHLAQKSRNHMLGKAKPGRQAVTTKSLQGSFNTLLDFHRMRPRDEAWILASAKSLNEQRFACNFSKLPTILSNVKKGECLAESGPATASRLLDMKHGQRSRDQSKIIHPCFDQMPDYSTSKQNSSNAYDVSYSQVERNTNSEYASTFLKKAGRAPAADPAGYSRFEDNCQHKTLRTCSDFRHPNSDTRPGLYSVATHKQDQPSIIDYERTVTGFASLSHCPRAVAHDFSAAQDREHEPSFMNKYIVNQHTEDISIDKLSYQDFLPNSIQRKIKKNSKIRL